MEVDEQNVFKANKANLSFIRSVCEWTEVGDRDLTIRGRERHDGNGGTQETFAGPVVSLKTKCLRCVFS